MSSLYLGVNQPEILKPMLGNWNVWYLASSDADPNLYHSSPLREPRMLYLNSPSLVKGNPGPTATVTAFAPCPYESFSQASAEERLELKSKHQSKLLELIERRFLPGLQNHLDAIYLRTPWDKEQAWLAPYGTVYGRSFAPKEVWKKVPYKGLLPNVYHVGAYVSFAGIASVIHGACEIYRELTGDCV